MRTSKFDQDQRRFALLAVEAGWTVAEVCRAYGVSRVTFYRWKAAEPADLDRSGRALLAALQAAPLTSERLQAALEELAVGQAPARRVRRTRAMREAEDRELAEHLEELAVEIPRWGYRRLHRHLLRKGYVVGLKRTYRVYIQAGLATRRERGQAMGRGRLGKVPPVTRPNEAWDVLMKHGVTASGAGFAGMRVSDAFTGEVLYYYTSPYPQYQIRQRMAELAAWHGAPERIHLEGDNRILWSVEVWAKWSGIKAHGVRDHQAPTSALVDWPRLFGPDERDYNVLHLGT